MEEEDDLNPLVANPIELLAELEASMPDVLSEKRAHERIRVCANVVVRPGNLSERNKYCFSGVSGNLSASGCQILITEPIAVGDIFLLEFDGDIIEMGPALALCNRCHLLEDEVFEASFAFFHLVDAHAAVRGSGD